MKICIIIIFVLLNQATIANSIENEPTHCPESKAASKVIHLIEKFEVELNDLAIKSISEATEQIEQNLFCVLANDDNLEKLSSAIRSIKFCNSLISIGGNLFKGEELKIKAKKAVNQTELEEALFTYASLYKSSDETTGFSCDLKTFRFTALAD